MKTPACPLPATIRRRGLGLLLLVLLVGCDSSPPGPPLDYPTITVRGRLTQQGRVVSAGWISFVPVQGTVGDYTTTIVDETGGFSCRRVPRGALEIRAGVAGQPARGEPLPLDLSSAEAWELELDLVYGLRRFTPIAAANASPGE